MDAPAPTPPPPPREAVQVDSADMLDICQSMYLALDARGRITLVNQQLCRMLGYERAELLGRDWFEDFVPAEDRDTVRARFEQTLTGDREAIAQVTGRVLIRVGQRRLVHWHNSLLQDGDGRRVGTLSNGIDVTERVRTNDQLRRSVKELEDIRYALDQASIVATTDQRGVIQYANDKFCEISGYAKHELVGQNHRLLNSGTHSADFFRTLWRTIASGQVWRGEIRNRAKDGRRYWVDTTIVPFLDESGKPYKYMAIRTDITERKRAEQRLREREALARLGEMAAVVAHEVKNPLTGISGAIQVIAQRSAPDSTERKVLTDIQARITSLNASLQDLLVFARPRPPAPAPVDVTQLLRDTAELVSRDPAGADVTVDLSGPSITLEADAQLLREAFLNLLLNAAQAISGAGTVRIAVALSGDCCEIALADDGPGIPAAVLDKIFQPFFTTRASGTGLGLSTVKRTIEAHGGEIEVTCPEGGGTLVTVRLPLTPHVDAP